MWLPSGFLLQQGTGEASAQDGERVGEDGSTHLPSPALCQAAAASPRCFRPCSWLNIERVLLLLLESFCLDEKEVMWGQVCAGAISLCLDMADRKQTINSFVGFNMKEMLGRAFGLLLVGAKVWESSGRGLSRVGVRLSCQRDPVAFGGCCGCSEAGCDGSERLRFACSRSSLAPGSPPTQPWHPGGDGGGWRCRQRAGRERDLLWVIGLGRGRKRAGIMGGGQKWMEGEMKRVDASGRLLIKNRRALWRIRHQRPRGN